MLRFATYPLAFFVISILPLLYFQTAIPESIVIIWVIVGVVPFFVVVPIYLVVARLRNFTRQDVEGLGCLLCLVPFLAAACVLVYQCFLWLMDGEWIEVSGSVVFEYVLGPDHPFLQWLNDPKSWHGLHRIVEILTGSLSFFLVLIGVAVGYLFLWVSDNSSSWFRPKSRD